ncbi:hypothetical protein CF065_02310 [Clostridium sporogenes]
MKAWRDKLDKLLDGEYKLFEEDYKITYPCVLKRGRKRIKGRIDMDRIINLAAGISRAEQGIIKQIEGMER